MPVPKLRWFQGSPAVYRWQCGNARSNVSSLTLSVAANIAEDGLPSRPYSELAGIASSSSTVTASPRLREDVRHPMLGSMMLGVGTE